MSGLSLYNMSDQYQSLLNNLCDPDTGVVDETALAKLNSLEDSIENKCINITKLFKSIELMQEAIKAEKERLSKRERTFKNQVERLRQYLQTNMETCDIKKIECPEFTISIQKNPQSLQIDDKNLIPKEYEKVTVEIDTQKIREDLKNGVSIPGVSLVQNQSLRIR